MTPQQEVLLDALNDLAKRLAEDVRSARALLADLSRRPVGRPPGLPRGGRVRLSRDVRYSGLTVAQAAAILGIGEEYVRRLLRKGELYGIPYGGRVGWRLPRDHVEELAAQVAATKDGQAGARIVTAARTASRRRKRREGAGR